MLAGTWIRSKIFLYSYSMSTLLVVEVTLAHFGNLGAERKGSEARLYEKTASKTSNY